MILLDGRNLNPLLFKFEQFGGWHLFWNKLPNFLPLTQSLQDIIYQFPSALDCHDQYQFYGTMFQMVMLWKAGFAISLTCLPAFLCSEGPPILPAGGWLVAVPPFPSHSSFERGRCAPCLLPTSVTHTETGNLFRSPAVLLGLGTLQTLGDMRTQGCGHWGCTFFACLVVKFVFSNFILFFIFSSQTLWWD